MSTTIVSTAGLRGSWREDEDDSCYVRRHV
jgi:hypothetical protein